MVILEPRRSYRLEDGCPALTQYGEDGKPRVFHAGDTIELTDGEAAALGGAVVALDDGAPVRIEDAEADTGRAEPWDDEE